MSERNIGRVISIDSFRVFIELDTDIKGLYKNSFFDLHEVAKINSYVIIPVNAGVAGGQELGQSQEDLSLLP